MTKFPSCYAVFVYLDCGCYLTLSQATFDPCLPDVISNGQYLLWQIRVGWPFYAEFEGYNYAAHAQGFMLATNMKLAG